MTVQLLPGDERWPQQFETVRGELLAAFGGRPVRVDHIGSTAVPGLCAKPVIDVLLGAPALADIEAGIPALRAAGYDHVSRYEAELPLRRYFVRPAGPTLRVHVHGLAIGSAPWRDHLAFRDALRADPALREAYAGLKRELARIHADDKPAYTAAKAPFITRVLASLAAFQPLPEDRPELPMALPPPLTVTVTVAASPEQAWRAFTDPASVTAWNFASPDWHCPRADNELRAGGTFNYRMEARDGSAGFDLEGRFVEVSPPQRLRYTLGEDREVTVLFIAAGGQTEVRQSFTPEQIHPLEMQREGWQAILDNYKRHAESTTGAD